MAIIWIKLDTAESFYDASQSVLITSDQVAAVTDTPYVQKAINDGAIQEATEQEYDDYIASIPVVPVLRDLGKTAAFDDAFAYEVGQMVLNEGVLYVANSDIVAGTDFVEGVAANEWTAVQTKEDSVIADKDTTTTTASLTYVDMANMSRTPTQAGTYLVQFSATVSNSDATKSVSVQLTGSAIVNASVREISCTTANEKHQVHCMGIITVDGLTAIKAQWKVAGGTGSCYQRQLLVTRIF